MKGVDDVQSVVDRIRNDLELEVTWYKNCKDSREAFSYIREKLETCGVVVMMSGVVGKNTHRALDIEEFRAFAMVDEWAPLIFINAVDSNGARLFSLLHEAAHIWLGVNDLYNDMHSRMNSVGATEALCNAIAAELIVPKSIFLNKWNTEETVADVFTVIKELAGYFNCGETVVARKAFGCRKITHDVYKQVVQNTIDNYNKMKDRKEGSGGNYYNTMGSRLDGCFVRALCESINMGRTSYTEAYRLTNTSRKTFSEVVQNLGGVEW
jgi:Zn-dependent peptidase ImmA (M78 family)